MNVNSKRHYHNYCRAIFHHAIRHICLFCSYTQVESLLVCRPKRISHPYEAAELLSSLITLSSFFCHVVMLVFGNWLYSLLLQIYYPIERKDETNFC